MLSALSTSASTAANSASLISQANSSIMNEPVLTSPVQSRHSSTSSLRRSVPLRAGAISVIDVPGMKFIIHDCPSDQNIQEYLREFQRYNVTDVVRVCEPSYDAEHLKKEGIEVHDWQYEDGGTPPAHVLRNWLQLVNTRFPLEPGSANASPLKKPSMSETDILKLHETSEEKESKMPVIAIHCVAGLGRAPVLVAVALIERGMAPLDAVEFVRRRRRGAFNSRQIQYLDSYKKIRPKSQIIKDAFAKVFTRKSG